VIESNAMLARSTSPARASRAIDVALRLADSLADPERVLELTTDERVAIRGRGIGGYPGLAMFYAAVLQVRDESRYRESLHAYMKAAAHSPDSSAGLFCGLGGLLAACNYVTRVEPRYSGLASRCIAALEQGHIEFPMRAAASMQEYDLITGASGVAIALAQSERADSARRLCDYIAWLLADATRWCCLHPVRPTEPLNDLGMAHGVAGMVAALAFAAPQERRYDDAIRSGLEFLASCRDAGAIAWPAGVGKTSRPAARAAWCYGAPGCASALFLGGRRIGAPEYERLGLNALRELTRKPLSRWGIQDNALCHGFVGNALVFTSLGELSGDTMLSEFGFELIDGVIEAYDAARPFGYPAMIVAEAVDAAGLLQGAAGIGLALLTAAGACDALWMPLFGIPPLR
jgi:lantibiotic biosynthesis protein